MTQLEESVCVALGIDRIAVDPLVLKHSWPLWEQPRQFELGIILNSVITDALPPVNIGDIAAQHSGCWECDLSDNSLTWSGGVYDIFGLPRRAEIGRQEAVAAYCERSRTAMEQLRAYAIKHKRGFTIDVEIKPGTCRTRWMRLVAAPVCEQERVVRLHGLKFAI
jgi:PAS domain-containing protein